MTRQTEDFIVGYLFSSFETTLLKAHMKRADCINTVEVRVPKSWFPERMSASKFDSVCLSDADRFKYIERLRVLFEGFNTEYRKFIFSIACRPDQQYMSFAMSAEAAPMPVEMTIEEIEQKLGYKIKVIGNKS